MSLIQHFLRAISPLAELRQRPLILELLMTIRLMLFLLRALLEPKQSKLLILKVLARILLAISWQMSRMAPWWKPMEQVLYFFPCKPRQPQRLTSRLARIWTGRLPPMLTFQWPDLRLVRRMRLKLLPALSVLQQLSPLEQTLPLP